MAGQPWLWLQTASALLAVSLASAGCIRSPCNNSNKLVCTHKTDTCTDESSQEHLITCIFDQNSKMGKWESVVNWGEGHTCALRMNAHTIIVQPRWTLARLCLVHNTLRSYTFSCCVASHQIESVLFDATRRDATRVCDVLWTRPYEYTLGG